MSSFRAARRADADLEEVRRNDEIGRKALSKASWRLLPLLGIGYAVAYIDRANVSYAALQMNRDLHFNAAVYGFGAGVFFISYAVCELPSNYLLLRFGARRWIARILLTWGLLAAAMVFVRSPFSFYALRFLLGMAEAGFFPGVIYYLSLWYPQQMRSRAISRFYISSPLSNTVMGLLAGSLLSLNGRLGLRGWQWLFLLEALPAVVLSLVVLMALPDAPDDAPWLNHEERAWLLGKLREESLRPERADGEPVGMGSHASSLAVLKDPRVTLVGLYFMCTLGSIYAFFFSAPSILVAVTGWSPGRVGLLLASMALLGAGSMVLVAKLSDHAMTRLPYIVPLAITMGAGFLVSGVAHSPWVVVPSMGIAMLSFYGMQGPALSLLTTFLEGPSAAIGIAAMNMLGITGGFFGPNWMGWAITHSGSYRLGLSMLCVPCVLAAGLIAMVTRLKPPGEGWVEAAH